MEEDAEVGTLTLAGNTAGNTSGNTSGTTLSANQKAEAAEAESRGVDTEGGRAALGEGVGPLRAILAKKEDAQRGCQKGMLECEARGKVRALRV
jgi:hypothetical protein